MFDQEAFIKRLEELMKRHGLSAAAFADAVGVQRSGISHILSGRNKPGLEFILKINDAFPDANLDWLLKGAAALPQPKPTSPVVPAAPKVDTVPIVQGETSKVIVLHPDGSFSEYSKRP